MKWKIEIEPKARKQIKKLDKNSQIIILKYIYSKILKTQNPYCCGKALTGSKKGLWRYRVNKYRIVCKIKDSILKIKILNIAKRDEVYED